MKLNLEQSTVNRINQELREKGKSHFKFEDSDFYVRVDDVSIPKDGFFEQVFAMHNAAKRILDEIIEEGLGQHFNITSIANNKFESVLQSGKIYSVYRCVNRKLDSVFPEGLLEGDDWTVSSKVNPNR